MEQTPRDIKNLISEYASGESILKLCQTSTKMRKICADSFYDNMWRKKIKEDFGINYTAKYPFAEYKFLFRASKTLTIYNVTYIDEQAIIAGQDDDYGFIKSNYWVLSFLSLEQAKNYIVDYILDDYIYGDHDGSEKTNDFLKSKEAEIRQDLNEFTKIAFGGGFIEITESKLS